MRLLVEYTFFGIPHYPNATRERRADIAEQLAAESAVPLAAKKKQEWLDAFTSYFSAQEMQESTVYRTARNSAGFFLHSVIYPMAHYCAAINGTFIPGTATESWVHVPTSLDDSAATNDLVGDLGKITLSCYKTMRKAVCNAPNPVLKPLHIMSSNTKLPKEIKVSAGVFDFDSSEVVYSAPKVIPVRSTASNKCGDGFNAMRENPGGINYSVFYADNCDSGSSKGCTDCIVDDHYACLRNTKGSDTCDRVSFGSWEHVSNAAANLHRLGAQMVSAGDGSVWLMGGMAVLDIMSITGLNDV